MIKLKDILNEVILQEQLNITCVNTELLLEGKMSRLEYSIHIQTLEEGIMDILERKKLKNLVIDRIQIKNAAKNPFKYIWDKEDFVKEIYFYQKSQAAAFSYLTDKESLDHDYSEFFLKRKILWMMDQNGIECSKQKATIKIEPRERTIRQRFKETYNLPDFISINKQKLEEICSPTNQKTSKKLWELFPPTTQKEVSECLGMTRLYLYIKDIPL